MSDREPLARTVPTARASRQRGARWIRLVPLAAVAAVVALVLRAEAGRGPTITIRASEGHGIGPGDAVRYRGIDVGEVVSAELASDLSEVVVEARLTRGAADLARAGTRFWVVRPSVTLDEVSGLETVFGARYIEALPGPEGGEPQTEFLALEAPPVARDLGPGGLDLVLFAARRHGLRAGSPVHYRGVEIGSVLSAGLSSDGADVELRVRIRAPYRRIVRTSSRFFVERALNLEVGLSGVELSLESLRSLAVGAIGVATPDVPGGLAPTGQRFELHPEPEPDWLEWRPPLPVGNALLPAAAPTPEPLRATASWTSERLFLEQRHRRTGWVIRVGDRLLGPAGLLEPSEAAEAGDLVLEVSGTRLAPRGEAVPAGPGVALLPGAGALGTPWPPEWVRTPGEPEDALAIGDPAAPALALAAGRLAPADDGTWRVDRAYSVDASWHGAPVFARSDGRLLGVLCVESGRALVAPVSLPR